MIATVRRVRRFIWVNRRMVLLAVFAVFMLPFAALAMAAPVDPEIDLAGLDFDEALDRYTAARREGGRVSLLIDGEETYRAFLDLIASAEDHLHVQTLNFDTDEDQAEQRGLEIARRLADRARTGVRVRVILDTVFQNYISRPVAVPLLCAGGVDVRGYMPPLGQLVPGRVLYRTHKKMIIADGARAIVGGSNLGSRYLGADQWRDTNAYLAGPVVAALQQEFLRDWANLGDPAEPNPCHFPPLATAGNVAIRAIDQRPADGAFNINHAVLIAVRLARHRIDIETPGFHPPDWLARELRAAAGRGVRVRVLTNSETSTNFPAAYWSGAYHFDELVRGGIEIHLWDRGRRTIHSKVLVVDDRLAMIGSYNFSNRSSLWDAENGIVTTDPPTVASVRRMVDADFGREFVVRVDEAWLHAQTADVRSRWRLGHAFGWLF